MEYAGEKQKRLGLHVEKDGSVTLAGKTFYGMGLNYYDGFNRCIQNPDDISYEDAMRRLSKAGIPFIRVSFNGYYPNSLKLYRDQPEAFFALADRFIRAAEENHIGVIPSLFWNYYSLPDLMQEPVRALGDPNSRTVKHARQFTKDVVTRYRDSRAVWGWEVGNEYNLEADLSSLGVFPPTAPEQGTAETRSAADQLTSDDVVSFYQEVAREVRLYDSYRLLTTGDAVHREFMMHLRRGEGTQLDTQAEFEEGVAMFTPDPLDTISTHIYIYDEKRFGPDRMVGIEELLQVYKQIGQKNGKAVYFGEFAAFGTDEEGEQRGKQLLPRIFQAIRQADIPLSSPWNFEMQGMTHGSFSDHGTGSFCFDDVVKINAEYVQKGLQDCNEVWYNKETSPCDAPCDTVREHRP